MRIVDLKVESDSTLAIVADDGRHGRFDIRPYLHLDVFQPLHDPNEFLSIRNGGYFVEWRCGADLSADTIEAHWHTA